ncbi:MAG: hypothetical protein EXS64_16385 [Candidatus Latescibacteria bacterium]|nr:hypothetical protein [Candidatus Latescibacterota bacterium]
MSNLQIPWAPRVVMAGRTFRLPVQSPDEGVTLEAGAFHVIASRWSARDSARFFYLRAPEEGGDHTIRARRKGQVAEATVRVRTLDDLRRPHTDNGATWPRRWPVGKPWRSARTRQTLQDFRRPETVPEDLVALWTGQNDRALWRQLPPAELPKAHYVNVHQGCPRCGISIFAFGGFYPWRRTHLPADFRSECPSCGAVFPSNDLTSEDFTSGDHPDDGFGYFDAGGNVFLFTASYNKDLIERYGGAIGALTARLRAGDFHEPTARQVGLMLLRYAVEECYAASAPQYRHGPSKDVEEPWAWGQPDWAGEPDPVAALSAKGLLRYAIDVPFIGETLALAYDTVWPLIREDTELVRRAQAQGLNVQSPEAVTGLIEEMLAVHLQCILDWGGRSNQPRESLGALILLRCLDRPDAQSVMDWLYDEGPDTLRVFTSNDFFPDGTPPESTGNYNSIHINGLFLLEHQLRQFRQQHPGAYPESRYPSLVDDPRVPRIALHPHEITVIGRSWFQFGDDAAPGSAVHGTGLAQIEKDCIYVYGSHEALERAAAITGDPAVGEVLDAFKTNRHRAMGSTILDGVGIAILRTPGTPGRASAGIVYGDTSGHRHRDLLDVQLYAYGRPFLSDLGYPQSWATRPVWEGHWATHNTVWGTLQGPADPGIAGRGRLIRTVFAEGIQVLDVEADRWIWDASQNRWQKPGVTFRRLIALVETDGEGVVLIDLSRVHGGIEHWRVCRGPVDTFRSTNAGLAPRPGTVSDPNGVRGATENASHPDHVALACMDDVAATEAPPAWRGFWQSETEPEVCLDLHQLRVTPGADLLSARATAVMGTPESSRYRCRTLLWRRRPSDEREATCVDLVFEPRVGDPTLAGSKSIRVRRGPADASGLELTTRGGRRIALYWSPGAGPEDPSEFEDGTRLQGALAAVVDEKIFAAGSAGLVLRGRVCHFESPRQTGRIIGLDRRACAIEVEGFAGIAPGDRIRVNPEGRGHTYRVEAVASSGAGADRLTLDVHSVLGRAKIVSVDRDRIQLSFHILARTGNLCGTRLQAETDRAWAEIAEAENPRSWPHPPGGVRTVLRIDESKGDADRIQRLDRGTWVQVVDYVVGDTVLFEPMKRG